MAIALALLWLIAGVAPALHHHEADVAVDSHCHDSGQTSSTHLETWELTHHEACGLCAMVLSFAHLDRLLDAGVEGSIAERAGEGSRLLPPGAPGRHGASRAPPLV